MVRMLSAIAAPGIEQAREDEGYFRLPRNQAIPEAAIPRSGFFLQHNGLLVIFHGDLVSLAVLFYKLVMRLMGGIFSVLICVGLIFQVSAQAASLPQAETMTLADCAKMGHHASHGSEHSGHAGQDEDAPCKDMSLQCMLSISAIAPVLMGNDLPELARHILSESVMFSVVVTDQLAGRALPPDYPPPRF